MEYFSLHPGNYGITINSPTSAIIEKDVRRKRRRAEKPRESRGNARHEASTSVPSAAVSEPATTTQIAEEFGEMNRAETGTDAPSSSSKAIASSLSTAGPTSSITDSGDAKRLEKLEARQRPGEERRKRIRRGKISREVGHEVDSDDERHYWKEVSARIHAEEARRQALSPEARRQEDIEISAETLRNHIKPRLVYDFDGLSYLDCYPLFVLQIAPKSSNGATCRLRHCTARIAPGQYRIALSPGDSSYGSPDYYHVKCFEELLDLSSPHYVARFVTDWKHRPDYGASCILEEYLSRWKSRNKQRQEPQPAPEQGEDTNLGPTAEQGTAGQNPSSEAQSITADTTTQQIPGPGTLTESAMQEQVGTSPNASRADLAALRDATTTEPSSTSSESSALDVWKIGDELWERARQNAGEASHDHNTLFDVLDHAKDADDVANASPDQDPSWRITQYVLPESDPDYDERHALSDALAQWKNDVFLADTDIDELKRELKLEDGNEFIEEIRQQKTELGELSLKRIERYNVVRMPNYESAFL